VEFDAETLIAELGGAENAVLLIHDFADTLHAELNCVHQALEDGDLERARLAAHRVKGSARTLRCEQLAEQLQTIEHHCRAEQLGQAREAYQQLEASLPALEMRLLQFCAQHMHS
jgi:HPt (histidine-containing phosphotransfer) domain-containing protein